MSWLVRFARAGLGRSYPAEPTAAPRWPTTSAWTISAATPIATGSNSDALLALNPRTRDWITLRVPYPLGFYSRGLDGRIDDASAGWKGRALYANYGTHFVWHIEGGKGTKGKIVKFQIRPDPLAR